MKSKVRLLADAMAGICGKIAKTAKEEQSAVKADWESWDALVAEFGQLDARRKVRVFGHLMDNINIDWSQMFETQRWRVTETLEHMMTELAKHLRDVHPDIKATLECREFSWVESGCVLDFIFWELFAEWAKFKVGLRGNAQEG